MQDDMHILLAAFSNGRKNNNVLDEFHKYDDVWHNITCNNKDSIKIRGWYNMKMSYQYKNSYYEEKTVSPPSHLYNGNPWAGKMASLTIYIEWAYRLN